MDSEIDFWGKKRAACKQMRSLIPRKQSYMFYIFS